MKMRILAFTICAMTLTGCSDNSDPDNPSPIPPLDRVELSPVEELAQKGMRQFGFELLNATEAKHENRYGESSDRNLTISPLSATFAMAMLANGGDETLTDAILKMLHSDDLTAVNTLCDKLLRFSASTRTMELANSVWYNRNLLDINRSFVKTISDYYYGDVNDVEFGTPKALSLINSWCAGRTHGKIAKVLEDTYSEDIFYLVNALYFRDSWKNEFDKVRTAPGTFNGKSVKEVMHNDFIGEFIQNDDYMCAMIPFKGTSTMVVIMPKDGSKLTANDIARTYDAAHWKMDIVKMKKYMIHLSLPKFDISNGERIESVLNDLGLPEYAERIDKMGIVKTDNSIRLKVIHHTSTCVTEKGAEAAAVTVVGGDVSAPAPETPEGEVTFNIDRPFVFFIIEQHTGMTVMSGRISNIA